jgi:ribosomal protein S18 acetylase RimI-like enzyme
VWADRTSAWTERLVTPQSGTITIVAELASTVVGLAHMVFDEDPTWGALLDNLHVTHELKGRGVGTRLLSHSAHSLITRTPAASLYLWVLAQNTAAQAFYAARGGQCVERRSRNPEPGDSLRIFWADPSRLIDPK